MNRRIGWTSLVIGIATGLVMGLWSFDGPVAVPAWLGAYGDTPRRLAQDVIALLSDDRVPDAANIPPLDGASRAASTMLQYSARSLRAG